MRRISSERKKWSKTYCKPYRKNTVCSLIRPKSMVCKPLNYPTMSYVSVLKQHRSCSGRVPGRFARKLKNTCLKKVLKSRHHVLSYIQKMVSHYPHRSVKGMVNVFCTSAFCTGIIGCKCVSINRC